MSDEEDAADAPMGNVPTNNDNDTVEDEERLLRRRFNHRRPAIRLIGEEPRIRKKKESRLSFFKRRGPRTQRVVRGYLRHVCALRRQRIGDTFDMVQQRMDKYWNDNYESMLYERCLQSIRSETNLFGFDDGGFDLGVKLLVEVQGDSVVEAHKIRIQKAIRLRSEFIQQVLNLYAHELDRGLSPARRINDKATWDALRQDSRNIGIVMDWEDYKCYRDVIMPVRRAMESQSLVDVNSYEFFDLQRDVNVDIDVRYYEEELMPVETLVVGEISIQSVSGFGEMNINSQSEKFKHKPDRMKLCFRIWKAMNWVLPFVQCPVGEHWPRCRMRTVSGLPLMGYDLDSGEHGETLRRLPDWNATLFDPHHGRFVKSTRRAWYDAIKTFVDVKYYNAVRRKLPRSLVAYGRGIDMFIQVPEDHGVNLSRVEYIGRVDDDVPPVVWLRFDDLPEETKKLKSLRQLIQDVYVEIGIEYMWGLAANTTVEVEENCAHLQRRELLRYLQGPENVSSQTKPKKPKKIETCDYYAACVMVCTRGGVVDEKSVVAIVPRYMRPTEDENIENHVKLVLSFTQKNSSGWTMETQRTASMLLLTYFTLTKNNCQVQQAAALSVTVKNTMSLIAKTISLKKWAELPSGGFDVPMMDLDVASTTKGGVSLQLMLMVSKFLVRLNHKPEQTKALRNQFWMRLMADWNTMLETNMDLAAIFDATVPFDANAENNKDELGSGDRVYFTDDPDNWVSPLDMLVYFPSTGRSDRTPLANVNTARNELPIMYFPYQVVFDAFETIQRSVQYREAFDNERQERYDGVCMQVAIKVRYAMQFRWYERGKTNRIGYKLQTRVWLDSGPGTYELNLSYDSSEHWSDDLKVQAAVDSEQVGKSTYHLLKQLVAKGRFGETISAMWTRREEERKRHQWDVEDDEKKKKEEKKQKQEKKEMEDIDEREAMLRRIKRLPAEERYKSMTPRQKYMEGMWKLWSNSPGRTFCQKSKCSGVFVRQVLERLPGTAKKRRQGQGKIPTGWQLFEPLAKLYDEVKKLLERKELWVLRLKTLYLGPYWLYLGWWNNRTQDRKYEYDESDVAYVVDRIRLWTEKRCFPILEKRNENKVHSEIDNSPIRENFNLNGEQGIIMMKLPQNAAEIKKAWEQCQQDESREVEEEQKKEASRVVVQRPNGFDKLVKQKKRLEREEQQSLLPRPGEKRKRVDDEPFPDYTYEPRPIGGSDDDKKKKEEVYKPNAAEVPSKYRSLQFRYVTLDCFLSLTLCVLSFTNEFDFEHYKLCYWWVLDVLEATKDHVGQHADEDQEKNKEWVNWQYMMALYEYITLGPTTVFNRVVFESKRRRSAYYGAPGNIGAVMGDDSVRRTNVLAFGDDFSLVRDFINVRLTLAEIYTNYMGLMHGQYRVLLYTAFARCMGNVIKVVMNQYQVMVMQMQTKMRKLDKRRSELMGRIDPTDPTKNSKLMDQLKDELIAETWEVGGGVTNVLLAAAWIVTPGAIRAIGQLVPNPNYVVDDEIVDSLMPVLMVKNEPFVITCAKTRNDFWGCVNWIGTYHWDMVFYPLEGKDLKNNRILLFDTLQKIKIGKNYYDWMLLKSIDDNQDNLKRGDSEQQKKLWDAKSVDELRSNLRPLMHQQLSHIVAKEHVTSATAVEIEGWLGDTKSKRPRAPTPPPEPLTNKEKQPIVRGAMDPQVKREIRNDIAPNGVINKRHDICGDSIDAMLSDLQRHGVCIVKAALAMTLAGELEQKTPREKLKEVLFRDEWDHIKDASIVLVPINDVESTRQDLRGEENLQMVEVGNHWVLLVVDRRMEVARNGNPIALVFDSILPERLYIDQTNRNYRPSKLMMRCQEIANVICDIWNTANADVTYSRCPRQEPGDHRCGIEVVSNARAYLDNQPHQTLTRDEVHRILKSKADNDDAVIAKVIELRPDKPNWAKETLTLQQWHNLQNQWTEEWRRTCVSNGKRKPGAPKLDVYLINRALEKKPLPTVGETAVVVNETEQQNESSLPIPTTLSIKCNLDVDPEPPKYSIEQNQPKLQQNPWNQGFYGDGPEYIFDDDDALPIIDRGPTVDKIDVSYQKESRLFARQQDDATKLPDSEYREKIRSIQSEREELYEQLQIERKQLAIERKLLYKQ